MRSDACRIKAFLTKIMILLWLHLAISHGSSWRWPGLCLNDQPYPLKPWFVRSLVSPSHCECEFPCQSSDDLTRFEPKVERKVQTPPVRHMVGKDEHGLSTESQTFRSVLDFFKGFSQSVKKIMFFLVYSTWTSKRLGNVSHLSQGK